jgi:FkbM family methyltransferase
MSCTACDLQEIAEMKYKSSTRLLHKIILFLKLDQVLARNAGNNSFLRKLVPPHFLYNGQVRIVKRDNAYFEVDLSDYMQWHIFSGIPEIAWKKAIASASGSNGAVIIDVGSNVGAFTIKAACNTPASMNTRFIAFDPNPAIGKKFLRNLELNNGISNNVSFQLAAVGNENKMTDFSFELSNTGAGRIGSDEGNVVRTKLVTLDSFVAENNIANIRFIKVDVEGFEPFVFEGAKKTITEQKPQLYFEITEEWHKKYGKSAVDIFSFLLDTGYTLYADKEDQLIKVDDFRKELESQFQNNFFAEFK